MILKDFISHIDHNSIIRLVYKNKSGHKTVAKDWQDVEMTHAITKPNSKYYKYLNHQVIHITSIGTTVYSDAINIVIEEIPTTIIRDNKLDYLINDLPF